MKNDTKTFSYQARCPLENEANKILSSYGELYASVQHHLFKDYSKGLDIVSLKSAYLIQFGLTARQFNGCRIALEGKIESIKQIRISQIANLKEKVASLTKKLPKIKDKKIKHQKSRSLHAMRLQLQSLEKEHKEGSCSMCFGSKKLFHEQFFLEENGYSSLKEWKEDWKQARSSEIFCIGSKDETAGNQSCVLSFDLLGKATLRLRLPNALTTKYNKKYLLIENIAFKYGHEQIQQALLEKKALSYRFKKDEKGWRVFISFAQERAVVVTQENRGAIGIDINVNHIALVETDAKGNPIYKESIPLSTYGKTKNQSKALIFDACKKIVALAKEKQKPLIGERLDFTKKKSTLKETDPKYARMLSSFHYSQVLQGLDAKSFREGVGFFQVNPAMTSVIGKIKFAVRYGLTTHQAAALCIARRRYRFSEAPSKSPMKMVHKNALVTCPLPERNREQHVWVFWKQLTRKLKAVLAAHRRASLCPS